jgi:uncharacterized protein Yka (UPF0111/DUF47 family)
VPIYGKGIFWARDKSEFWEYVGKIDDHANSMHASAARMRQTARDIFSGNLEIDFGPEKP